MYLWPMGTNNSLRACCICCMDASYVARGSHTFQMHTHFGSFVSGLMNGENSGLCLQCQLACLCVCLFRRFQHLEILHQSLAFFFFSLSFCLDKSSKQEKEDRQRRNPHKVKNRPGNLGRFPSLHKFSFLLKLDIVTGWERSLDGASSPAVSCFFCGVWGFLRWSLWQEWFEVFPAAHLIVLAKQKQLCVVVWERKWGAGEGGSTLSQCWRQKLYLVKPQNSSCT